MGAILMKDNVKEEKRFEDVIVENGENTENKTLKTSKRKSKKGEAEKKVAEITKCRGGKERSREYQLSDGNIREEYYSAPVHYFNLDTCSYETIDNMLVQKSGDSELGDYYENTANSFKVKFPKKKNALKHMQIEKDGCRISLQLIGVAQGEQGNIEVKCVKTKKEKGAFGEELFLQDGLMYEDILPNTDLKFEVKANAVKDYLIIKSKNGRSTYSYKLQVENLKVQLNESGEEVEFISETNGNKVFVMPAPYAEDAKGSISEDAYYEIERITEKDYVVHVKLNEEWLNSPSTVTPILIDPEIVVLGEEEVLSRYGWHNGTMSVAGGGSMKLGYYNPSGTATMPYARQYYKVNISQLQFMPIKKVELVVTLSSTAEDYYIAVGKTAHTLSHTSSTACNPSDEHPTDYVKVTTEKSEYRLDITSLIKRAFVGTSISVCFYLKGLNEATSNQCLEISSSKLAVEYVRGCNAKSLGTEIQQDVSRAGIGSVNLHTGVLKFRHQDFSWSGNVMPLSIYHIFNGQYQGLYFTNQANNYILTANYAGMRVGTGWKLNIQQSVIAVPVALGLNESYKYVYNDEDGIEHFLIETSKTDIYADENGDGIEYDSSSRILMCNGLKHTFNETGHLIQIENQYGDKQSIIYGSGGQILKVIDGVGREFLFTYNTSAFLSKITLPNGANIEYTYAGQSGYYCSVSQIKYPDGHITKFSYDVVGNLRSVINCYNEDGVYKAGYKVSYTYAAHFGSVVMSIVQNGITSDIDYKSKNLTVVSETGDDVTMRTAYEFDNEGRFITSYELKDGEDVKVNNNLLRNATFGNFLSEWTVSQGRASITAVDGGYSNALIVYGVADSGLEMVEAGIERAAAVSILIGTVQQSVTVTAGKYTLSAYLRKKAGTGSFAANTANIELTGGGATAASQLIRDTQGEFQRISCTLEVESETVIVAKFVSRGTEWAYFSGVQLQKGETAGDYNYLHDGSFERGTNSSGWSGNNFAIVATENHEGSYCAKLSGATEEQHFVQRVYVHYKKSTRETFELSGWAKAYCPLKQDDAESKFKLLARIVYQDDTFEEHEASFTSNFAEWQYVSVTFSKKEYRQVKHIDIYGIYNYPMGEAYFDGLQLIRTNEETGLSSADFFEEEYEETDDEDTTTDTDTETETTTESDPSLDAHGNSLWSINNTEGKRGSLYQTYGYSANGNHKMYETDHRSNRTLYTYYENTSLVKTVQAPCRSTVSYTYDTMNQLTTMSMVVDGQTIAVNYTYDYIGNVKTITQNGFTYAIGYDLNNNVTSIGVEGQTSLVEYTYTAGNNLKTATYANGHKATYSYDRYGNVISESWENGEIRQAEYAYTYDEEGNVIKTLDKTNKLLYTYKYENGQLKQAEEYTFTDDLGANKTLRYYRKYQHKGDVLSRRTDVFVNGTTEEEKVYEYHYFDEDDKFTLMLPTNVKSLATVDHFGRKSFDELQLGTGFIRRDYSYVEGAYEASKLSGNLKSLPETELVSKIVYDDGKELRYTYDTAGNIKTVRNEYGVLLEAYSYDGLGRLKTEQNVTEQFYKVYTYDAGGNITEKKTYNCTSTSIVTSATNLTLSKTDTYTYDSVWKDKLTGYNNDTYAYDGNGNPVTIKGMTATWEKGRQLKTLGNHTYTYNASGVRISKTVNGIAHTYTVEGIKILREEYEGHVLDFLYGVDGEIVGFTDNGTAYYYYKNLQGDVISITDKDGAIVATYVYDAWGKVLACKGDTALADLNPIRYRGYYYDAETELYYLNSRYYDPEVCRFINADEPKCIIDSNPTFAYAENNPVNMVDISGFFAIVIGVGTVMQWLLLMGVALLFLWLLYKIFQVLFKELEKLINKVKVKVESNNKKENKKNKHHIIPQLAGDTKEARDIWTNKRKMGISIHDDRNLALIWDCYHQYMHTKEYYKYINKSVQDLYKKVKGKKAKKSSVLAFIAELKKQLETAFG